MKLEQVLAVKAAAAKTLMQGVFVEIPDGEKLNSLFPPQFVMIGSRAWLETDEKFLQLIPYTLIMSRNGQVLAYSRTSKGGEGRLHDKVSVGFGGHINVLDLVYNMEGYISLDSTVYNSTKRELHEEISTDICSEEVTEEIGLLYDPSDEVGRVHLGVVQTLLIDENVENTKHKITTQDDGITILGFFDKEYLLTSEEVNLESWSRIALENLR